jgi:single-strand DNA-binding protein
MNSVNLIGRLGRDPELRYTPSGKAVCEINVAVDDGWGENKKTAWIGVVLWEKKAELAAQHLHKGDQVGITGRLSQDSWDDKETGKKQTKTKVTADSMHFVGGKKEGQSAAPATQDDHNRAKSNAYQPDMLDDEDDTPPF